MSTDFYRIKDNTSNFAWYNKYRQLIIIQSASLTNLAIWYPFYYAKIQKEVTAIHSNVLNYKYLTAGIKPGFFRSMLIPLAFQPIFPMVFGFSLQLETYTNKLVSYFLAGCATGPIANILSTYQIRAQQTG